MSSAAVLIPIPGNAGHVVGRVARERLHVDHAFRPDAEALDHLLAPDRQVLGRVEHRDAVADELHQVLVRGHDHHLVPLLARHAGEGGDQIVGLEPRELDARHVEGARRVPDEAELRHQLFRRVAAVRLVVGEDVVAEGDARAVEDHRETARAGIAQQLRQHLGEAEHRVDRDPFRVGHRRQAVEGAEDVARPVDQIDRLRASFSGLRHRPLRPPGPACRAGRPFYTVMVGEGRPSTFCFFFRPCPDRRKNSWMVGLRRP